MKLPARIEDYLKNGATGWMKSSDIAITFGCSSSQARRALRKLLFVEKKAYREKIPGDRYQRFQWCHEDRRTEAQSWPKAHLLSVGGVLNTSGVTTGRTSARSVSATSHRRNRVMCITVNKPTFEKAVEDVVTEMVSAKKTFSAHDVTKTLREKVNADQITVDTAETGVVHVAGKAVARIDHDTVKDVLSNLWDDKANKMVNYDRTFNGTYMEFAPGAPLTTGVVAPDPDPATTAAVSGSSYDGSSTI